MLSLPRLSSRCAPCRSRTTASGSSRSGNQRQKVRLLGRIVIFAAVAGCATSAPDAVLPYRVEGDAIRERLAPVPGDAARGKAIVVSRDSNCLLCHAVPDSGVRFMGNIGRPLEGVGAQLTEGQLR